jgi:Protein of unknown function (DUF1565)
MRKLIILFSLFAAAYLSFANTIAAAAAQSLYVSTTGNDANPGTESLPWRTIQHAMDTAPAGSTVNIMAGVYHERLILRVSGTAGTPIIFQPNGYTGLASDGTSAGASIAYNGYKIPVGDSVILDYAYLGTVTDHVPFLNINNQSYVTIQGLTFQNFTCNGAYQQGMRIDGGAHNLQVLNCRFLNNKNIYPAPDGTAALLHIRLWNCRSVSLVGNEMGNIVTSMSEVCTMDTADCTGALIYSNYIHDCDGIAIDVHGGANNAIVQANLIEYAGKKRDGTLWYNRDTNVIYVDGGNSSIMERNLVRYSGWAFANLSEPGEPACHDIIVRNNIAYSNDQAGIQVGNWYSDTDGSMIYNIKILNNTLVNNGYGFVIRPYTSASVEWENNILEDNRTGVANNLGWPVGTMNYNLYYGNSAGPDAEKITANPLFIGPAASPPDFSLHSTSPAINAGDPSFVPGNGETDFAGHARVVGGRVDIGAYEY